MSINVVFDELLFLNKTYIQLREQNGRVLPQIAITKREYQLLKVLHDRNGKRVEYAIIGRKVEKIMRGNAEKNDPKNRIIQIYKGLKKKLNVVNKNPIIKDYYGLKLICKSKKI